MSDFFEDNGKLTFPKADVLVDRFIDERGSETTRVTSADVLKASDYDATAHNQLRVYDALQAVCRETEKNWAGRRVFEIPEDDR